MPPSLGYAACVVSLQPPTIRVVAAMVARDGRYLITQRRPSAVLPLLWEFPGGRVEPGESDHAALKRELQERLAVEISVGELISFVSHRYEHYTVELYLYECTLESKEVRTVAVQDARWVASKEFDEYDFTPADEASMTKLLGVQS
jgi:8-oxo-dGTP diphosphatase